jgi:hypothetical protein
MDWVIYKDGVQLNVVRGAEDFVREYCAKRGYTYELRPEPEHQENANLEEMVIRLTESNRELREALDLLLSGVTE